MMIVELFHALIEDVVARIDMPQHIKVWSNQKKLEWISSQLQPLLEALYIPFEPPAQNMIPITLQIGQQLIELQFPPHLAGTQQEIHVNDQHILFDVPAFPKPPKQQDQLYNYSLGYLRSMMDFIVLDNVIHDGDIDLLGPTLKRMIPNFIGLTSFRSKYAIEAVNFITKTEWSLSERESVVVKLVYEPVWTDMLARGLFSRQRPRRMSML